MILVIDGNNLANMCAYIGKKVNRKTYSASGLDTRMINMFMKKLYGLYDNLYPDEIIICWDKRLTHGFTNFRKQEATYKSTRVNDPKEREVLFEQCGIIENMVEHLGIKNIHPNVMEADDVIAWIAHTANDSVVIGSFDQDLLQLVNENVEYFDLRKKEKVTIENFEDIYGVPTNRFLLYKMVLGDRSDNITGLKGYGKVKSKKMVDCDAPFAGLTLEQKKLLAKNRKLMDLRLGYMEYPEEVPVYEEQFKNTPLKDFDKFVTLARLNNLEYVLDYKWKWEDLSLNT